MDNNITYDIVEDEKDSKIKKKYWDIAFGLQKVDELTPSKYMYRLSEKHIDGEKTYNEVKEEITKYYENNNNDKEQEADKVSTAIYEILNDKSFRFDYMTLKNYHKRLFSNLNKEIYNPGIFRLYNITKEEPILNNDTVNYQSYDMIEETLKYDFIEEKEQNYIDFNDIELIERISTFTSRIWQIHPFQEGNTRTIAVFIQKYLISMGFNVNNELFKNNSKYFRNALVRANYTNYNKKVNATNKYLIMFFENLLLNKSNELDNNDLKI